MKCPACFNELTEIQVGNVQVDVCHGGCGGVWLDAFELQRVDEESETAGAQLLDIPRDETVVVDFTRKRDCPRCAGVKLKRHFFSARRQVEVDECPNCGGYWLDAGELARIRAEKTEEAKGKPGRSVLSQDTLRYLCKLQTRGSKQVGE
jgi:Zn-finger nucleic acid-binding protein